MRTAFIHLLIGALILGFTATVAGADEQIVVIRATSIAGLADYEGRITETRDELFSRDGAEYTIARSALAELDGIRTLLLVDYRRDAVDKNGLVRRHGQEVYAIAGDAFTVGDIPGKPLSFQVATVDGRLGLLGDGDQILCPGGPHGPFHIWKIEGIELVGREALRLR